MADLPVGPITGIRLGCEAASGQGAVDGLCALWVDRAPRFGAVAAHFPRSLRARQFAASFWAPEVLLFGGWYLEGFTRGWCDQICALLVERAGPEGEIVVRDWFAGWVPRLVDTGKPAFWSPELPEVEAVTTSRVEEEAPILTRTWVRGRLGTYALDHFTRRALSAFLLLLCLALPAGAQSLYGTVARVVDGDTILIGKARVRLYGIDAPEGQQECTAPGGKPYRCGDTAKGFLASLAPEGAQIQCVVKDTARYGRLVARCGVNGKDLSLWMVRAGWALAYREYSTAYVVEEMLARRAGSGIWAGSFVSPEEWRHAH